MKVTDIVTWGLIGLALYLAVRGRAPQPGGLVHVQQAAPDVIPGQGAAPSGMVWEWDSNEGAWNARVPPIYVL